MAKFVYKYESVKKVKENLEKKAQKELALIDLRIETVEREILAVEEERKQLMASGPQNKKIKISEVHP